MKRLQTVQTLLTLVVLAALPFIAGAQGGEISGTSLDNPLAGPDNIFDLVYVILNGFILPIASIVIVFFIIYSGFLFVTARGDVGKIDHAKEMLKYVVIGAAVLLGSWAIAAAIGGTICQITGVLCNQPPPNNFELNF
jgi:ABC-type multidrug transport system permease subunit